MFKEDKAYKENYQRLAQIAEANGYVFNRDKKRVNKVVGLMTSNFKEFGKFYCPCKQTHPLDTKTDPLCPCDTLDDEIEKDGHCYCRLFYKGGNS